MSVGKRKLISRKLSKNHFYDFRVDKVRYRGSTGESDKAKAEKFEADLKALKIREANGLEFPKVEIMSASHPINSLEKAELINYLAKKNMALEIELEHITSQKK